jgi:hypothetical protein
VTFKAETVRQKLQANDLTVLHGLPDDVDVELVMGPLRRALPRDGVHDPHRTALPGYFTKLPLSVLRACVAELARQKNPPPLSRYLLGFVSGAEDLQAAWRAAVETLPLLSSTRKWGGRPHKQEIRLLAAQPQLVDALRGAVVVGDDLPNSWRAVLVAEGSEASVDALLPTIDRAFREGGRLLQEIDALRPFSESPSMLALFDENARRLQEQRDNSPARRLAALIGLGKQKRVRFAVALESTQETLGMPAARGYLRVDSNEARWFSGWLARWNELPVDCTDAFSAPAFFAREAKRLGATLRIVSVQLCRTERERDLIRRWLMG